MVNVRDISDRMRAEAVMAKSIKNLRAMLNKTVNALAIVTEIRDPYTAGHQHRVAHLACAIAQEMNLSKKQVESINIAGILHDIGKIFVPSEILSKPGKLTELEMQLIKTHPLVGKEIVEPIPFDFPISKIIAQHHEKLNGSGYPYGLVGSQISIEARILAVADVVEAIASHRPYRPALGMDTALDEIQRHRGTFYDSEVVDACLSLFQNKGFRFDPSPMDKRFEHLTGL